MRRPQRFLCNHLRWLSPLLVVPLITLSLLLLTSRKWYLATSPSALPSLPRLAYLISGTSGDSHRLRRILHATYHPLNYYVLHLDLTATRDELADLARHVKFEAVFAEVGNVWVVEKPNQVTDKGPTEIACTLHAVAILLKEAKGWDWFFNLAASDYPLLPQDDIIHIFSYLPRDLNFIQHTTELGWKESQRVRPIIIDPGLYGVNKSNVFWAKERRALPSAFKLFVGPASVILTRSFLEFCIWGWDNLPRTLLMYYTNYLQAPEGYFHSVICNSKDFQNTTVNHDLRFVKWDNPPRQQPAILTDQDFNLMVESGAPFARNFVKDGTLLDRIDKELLGKSNGQFISGHWCLGSSLGRTNSCTLGRIPTNIRPTSASKRLAKLLVEVLDPKSFRSKQCT